MTLPMPPDVAERMARDGVSTSARHLAMLAVDEQGGLVLATAGSPSLTASTRTGVTRVPVTVEGGVLRWETERLGTRSRFSLTVEGDRMVQDRVEIGPDGKEWLIERLELTRAP